VNPREERTARGAVAGTMAYYKGSYSEQVAQLKIFAEPAITSAAAIAAERTRDPKTLSYQGLKSRERRRKQKEQEQRRLEAHSANPIRGGSKKGYSNQKRARR